MLDYHFAHQWWMDWFLRLPTIVMGTFAIALAVAYLVKTFRAEFNLEPSEVVAFFVLGCVATLQEAEQWGQPMVWWRLPLLLVGMPATIVAIWHRPASKQISKSDSEARWHQGDQRP